MTHAVWLNLREVSDDLRQKQQEAKAARCMSFKIANFTKVTFHCWCVVSELTDFVFPHKPVGKTT